MNTVNIGEAKIHLSRLIDEAVNGEPFIIAKAGKPLVLVTRLDGPVKKPVMRLGFMAGHMAVPADFKQIGSDEIALRFGQDA